MAPRAPKKAEESAPKTTTGMKTTAATKAKTTNPVIVTPADIAFRAYMISLSPEGGDQLENWLRAEQELAQIAA